MSTNFPSTIDSLTNPTGSDSVVTVDHAAQHANANDAIEALQAKVGADSSAVTSSHDYKIDQLETKVATVETNADVTDATNVEAAGAIMDGDFSTNGLMKRTGSGTYDTAVADTDYQSVLSEGAFADGDKTKLDAIESGADVTDTANVTAAGALMDSEVTNLADVKSFDPTDYATAAQGTLADSAVQPSSTDTLQNKTIDGDNNTISNLDIGNEVDWAAATDVTDRSAAPASGDKMLLFEAGVGLRKIDWDDLPGAAGGDEWGDAVDADIIPDADGTRDLGSTANRFAETHTDLLDIAGTTNVTAILDEDNMASDSATSLATQQSIKAYVDANGGTGDVTAASAFGNDNRVIRSDGTGKGVQASGISIDDSDNVSGVGTLNSLNLPSSDFSGVSDTETLTNKTIDADNNTVSNIGTAELSDEGVTFAKMQHISTNRILGRNTAGTGDVESLTGATVRDIIGLDTDDSPQFNAVNIGHATDTTITRVSAGVIAVEGSNVLMSSDKTGSDAGVVSGTAGTNGNLAEWNADGDLVGSTHSIDQSLNTTSDVTFADVTYTTAIGNVSALGNLGATEAIDWSAATHFTGTLDNDVTITHSNEAAGQKITIALDYDGSAQRTITWSDVDKWQGGSAPDAPSASGETLVVTLVRLGTTVYGSGAVFS